VLADAIWAFLLRLRPVVSETLVRLWLVDWGSGNLPLSNFEDGGDSGPFAGGARKPQGCGEATRRLLGHRAAERFARDARRYHT
jgi:hypothetical protein